jgi:hypothetical protein
MQGSGPAYPDKLSRSSDETPSLWVAFFQDGGA